MAVATTTFLPPPVPGLSGIRLGLPSGGEQVTGGSLDAASIASGQRGDALSRSSD
jgi:hypothetical protein